MELQDYVDLDCIGIWGSSYGGIFFVYLLLMKLGLFQVGVVVVVVVDLVFFGMDDVVIVCILQIYLEIFERKVVNYVVNLEDKFLFIYGMQDYVVFFKIIVVLVEELIK